MALDHVAVIGAGEWGTALAQAAALAGRKVTLVARNPAVVTSVNFSQANAAHLPQHRLHDAIRAETQFSGADFLIVAVPAQATRVALAGLRLDGLPVVLSAKGLEHGSLKRQSEVLAEVAPGAIPFVLSGPSFAVDVVAGRPTAVTLAGDDAEATEAVAAALASASFRPYAAGDRIGVELAGALKNVYALGAGAVEGAGLGASARAGLIARAFAELSRLIPALGGQAVTLSGLAGLGDLTLSCTSQQSRNYRHGMALGRGEPPPAGLAEGVFTAPVAQALAHRAGIDAPLIDAVNLLLTGKVDTTAIVAGLMTRPLKRED
jgi:glycerol-3-phosphate dehydrogenase (NAD(P)+)